MKKLFTSILSVLLLIVLSVAGLAGCGKKDGQNKQISLDVTAKTLTVGESFTLTATTTPADATIEWSSSDETIVTVDDGVVLGVSEGSATVTAKNDTATATCEITVTAAEEQTYTILFKNGETEIKSMEVVEGGTIAYVGAAPSKANTDEFSYTFIGWSLTDGGEVVDIATITADSDKTFYAVFSQTVREYTVTWMVNGETTSETYAYGEVPAYKNVTPTKPSVGSTSYTFLGWSKTMDGSALETLPATTGNVTYYAIFDEVLDGVRFTVTWMNGESVLKTDDDVHYEAQPEYVGETPVKEMTTESEYVFIGWATSANGEKLEAMPAVTANATFYAVFEEVARKYTITWVIEGAEETSQVAYGNVPAYEGTPEKADSAECSFKFIGWSLSAEGEVVEALPEVSGEATYYAIFDIDEIFTAPKFLGGTIDYSANSQEIFLPDGLLGEGVTIVSAIIRLEGLDKVVAYENGAWVHSAITLTEEELKGNLVGLRTVEVELSNGAKYSVDMNVYAGIINELSDFPMFFNNTGIDSTVTGEDGTVTEFKNVAPYTYGYYIVTQDLGSCTITLNEKREEVYTYADELSFDQVEATDYQATNGFNGVLDGQGHTLKFKLTKGGLVGLVLGNAVIKNLGIMYEDATTTYYGVLGYITNGHPEIRNCYIERTNNHYQAWSVFGIMSRPNAKLVLHNTVVYGYNTSNNSAKNGNMWLDANSTNAYIIHARANAMGWVNVQGFTKVFTDALMDGSREVLLSEIEDASGFDDNYWSKENGKLIWKGFETATVTWVKGEETFSEVATKGDWLMYTQTLPENVEDENGSTTYYWSKSQDGSAVAFSDRFKVEEDVTYYMVVKEEIRYYTVTWIIDGVETTTDYRYNEAISHEDPVKAEDNYYSYKFLGWSLEENGALVEELGNATEEFVYYAVFEKTAKVNITTVNEAILYSTADNTIFFPEEMNFTFDETVKITAMGDAVYYENGEWKQSFALDANLIKDNAVATFHNVAIQKGEDLYMAKVKSYAGVIDELSDFPKFFNNDPSATHPKQYGYYIVVKDLGTGAEELSFTQSMTTDYKADCGFNGVLDGAGHTIKFKLMSGGLVGLYIGNGTIKNLSVIYADETSTQYGVFGYMTSGNPVIDNCYIERTNNKFQKWSVFGIMSRPNAKLTLKNTVVYGYNISTECAMNSNMWISASSTNAYLIHARANATGWVNVQNFTKVFNDGIENGAREVALSEIADNSGFNANWSKEDGKLTWKGSADMAVSVYTAKYVEELDRTAYFSTVNGEMILPDEIKDVTVVDAKDENGTDYYENGVWQNVALTVAEIKANLTKTAEAITIETSEGYFYKVNVKSYAGVIDELSDFPVFFDNEAVDNTNANNATDYPKVAPSVYGYYIVTKDLGTGAEELSFTQCAVSNFTATCGFNGVLDGAGHTLRFKLMSGGLVGQILGNATIKNLGVIYADETSTQYGVFGYMTNGNPVIENCYIERTNNKYQAWSVFGIMSRPNAKLILKNTVVYGFNISQNCAMNSNMWISASSTNAYLIHARANAMEWVNVQGFTKVFTDAIENGSREVLLSEIADASGFDNNYWSKENGKLIWKGFETVTVTWENGRKTIVEAATKGHKIKIPALDNAYWAVTEDGSEALDTKYGVVAANADVTYYAILMDQTIEEKAFYSTLTNEFFLPDSMDVNMNEIQTITSADGGTIYYEDGAWQENFALTAEQINANETKETAIKVYDGEINYFVTVASCAGVIDELNDFPKFFNNDPSATHPKQYGYYIVVKDLGTGAEELSFTQSMTTDYKADCGFNGVLDGAGHTIKFKLMSGGLVGLYIGNGTIKNLSVIYADETSTQYGVFGYMTSGNPVIDNCYIERTNNKFQKWSVFGIMSRPNAKLTLKNTVVYGYNISTECAMNSNMWISASSTNAYLIHARANATGWVNVQNFTKVFNDGVENGAREVALSKIADASDFDDNYWSKEDGKLTWKGAEGGSASYVTTVELAPRSLVKNGKTQYAVVIPNGADATLTTAQNELVSLFAEATGATLAVASDGAYSTEGAYISIGNTQTFANSGVTMGEMNSQGYHLERVDNTIYINGETSLGCMYGVYGLLEDVFGFEQFSEDTYAINEINTVDLFELKMTENPDFEFRMPTNSVFTNNENYANRMRMGTSESELILKVGDYINNKGEPKENQGWTTWHNTLNALPPSYWKNGGTYKDNTVAYDPRADVRPLISVDKTLSQKWFSDDNAKQLCYTAHGDSTAYDHMVNAILDVMALVLTSSQPTLYPDVTYLTLTSEDGGGVCTCPACTEAKGQYGSDVGAVIKLCNDVRAEMETWMNANPNYKRDNLKLLFFAYNDYVTAPTAGTITMRKDVGVVYAVSDYVNYYFDIYDDVNATFRAQFDAWAALTTQSGSDLCLWTYTKNFRMYMLRADVYGGGFFNDNAYSYFANAGVDFFFNQGATNGTNTLSAFEKLNAYLDSKMMWNSQNSIDELIENWFSAMYGDASESMLNLYNAQNAAARAVFGEDKLGIPSVTMDKSSAREVLTVDVLDEWFGYIEQAKIDVETSSFSDAEKAKMTAHINEEWISVKFLYVYLYYQEPIMGFPVDDLEDGVTVDIDAAQAEFRAVLGYNADTKTYEKDVVLLERGASTLAQWIDSNFTSDI